MIRLGTNKKNKFMEDTIIRDMDRNWDDPVVDSRRDIVNVLVGTRTLPWAMLTIAQSTECVIRNPNTSTPLASLLSSIVS